MAGRELSNADRCRSRSAFCTDGNLSAQSLIDVVAGLPAPTVRDRGLPRLLVTCHRRESWGDGLQSIASALVELAHEGRVLIDFVLHPNAPSVPQRDMERLA